MEKEYRVGSVWRITGYDKDTKKIIEGAHGDYVVVKANGVGKCIQKSKTTTSHEVGGLFNISKAQNSELIADSLEEYNAMLNGVPGPQFKTYYNETIIDKLYNYYCALIGRDVNKIV